MGKIGRNDLCPCGSGKKFKKCHMGKEDELLLDGMGDVSIEEMGRKIVALPSVDYGRTEEIITGLDLKQLVNSDIGIKFIDLDEYRELNLFGAVNKKRSRC